MGVMSSAFLVRFACIVLGLILLAHNSYGNSDCQHVTKELEPCYVFMRNGGIPTSSCCQELRQEVRHPHNNAEYVDFYCCVRRIYESLFAPGPVPPPPVATRLDDLLQRCGIIPPYRVPGPPYPAC